MISPSAPGHHVLPIVIELGLTAIAIAVTMGWPHLGSSFFSRVERTLVPLAKNRRLAVVVVGFAGLLLRLAILPVCPIPNPFVPDDFSFLLAADTFAQGRLTNPTPPMWIHFESIHITMQPTYISMYFPAQGLILAAGRVFLGHPWFGQLVTSALMCAAICWMLQGWLPATWAFLGGVLAIMHLGLFCYWINTYHAGAIAALGGAMVIGALPRLMKRVLLRHGLIIAAGIIMIALSRPFEGLLLCIPVSISLGRWMLWGKNRPAVGLVIRRAALPLALIAGAAIWLGYYDYRAFGSPLALPYTAGRTTYAMAPYFVWQKPRPEPLYRHPVMRQYYRDAELKISAYSRSLKGYLFVKSVLGGAALLFFAGVALLPPLIMLPRLVLDRRIRFLIWCIGVLIVGAALQTFLLPHYLAPFTAVFYAIGLQAMRHLRLWRFEGKPSGLAITRMIVTISVIMTGMRLFAGPLRLALPQYPATAWNSTWYGPDNFGTERSEVENFMEHVAARQLAIVRYSPCHNPYNEWVFNAADIENAKIIWAREMDSANNLELIRYYPDRKVWLVEPDAKPPRVAAYPVSDLATGGPLKAQHQSGPSSEELADKVPTECRR